MDRACASFAQATRLKKYCGVCALLVHNAGASVSAYDGVVVDRGFCCDLCCVSAGSLVDSGYDSGGGHRVRCDL